MDPASTPLGRMLSEEITPVVMVLRTPLVEEACLKNGLSFVQMLQPFCAFNNIDVPVRTASDQPYRVQKFKLRLYHASDIRQPNLEVAKDRLKQVITQAGEDLQDLSSDPPNIENVLTTSQSELLPSWFQVFNEELVRTLSFSDHEAFDHPVACLLVASSKDAEPLNHFVDLFNTNQLPALLNDGMMDPKILKHYILVHDNQDGPPDRAAELLTKMKSTFGSSECRLLCINSSEDVSVELEDNPWTFYKADASSKHHLGCYLSVEDLNEIKDLGQDLSAQHIIPHMEQKIRMLNQQVSTTRKGFRNQIKNLWWRKGKDDTPDTPNGPTYTFSSIESQIRVLADYAFMLRDYELALSNYRLLSTDYKLDKAWKRYAGVQEMMGIAYFMLDQSRKEAEYCMENALSTYLKIGSLGLQNAIRCGLWWAEMLKTRDQFKEAASAYFRVAGEEPLHSAVMLEQASYCYLFSRPAMLRKYGFHLVLAGDIYRRCDQIKHAIRTYRSALSVYQGTTWNHVNDHVHFHIGKWFAFLGMSDVAVPHMLEILACSHQSRATQEFFLRSFLQIVQKTGRTFEVPKLQLPVINMASLKVMFEDHRTYASPEAVSVRESLWQSLEEDVIPLVPTSKTNWLQAKSKIISKKYKESSICVAGEAVKVNIEFRNPLQISVSISNVSLMCKHSTKSDDSESGSREEDDCDETYSTCREATQEVSQFTLSEADISLGGGESAVVQLTVIPRAEGLLKIVGVKWKLSGSVVGFRRFELRKKVAYRKRRPRSSPSDRLNFVVIKSVPKLEGFIRDLPQTVYMGDLRRPVLDLRNHSEFPVKNLKMKISHPRFLGIGNKQNLEMEFPACLEKDTTTQKRHEQMGSDKASNTVFSFPEETIIQGEKPFLWPLWLHAAVPGSTSLCITIYYEIEDIASIMKYRTLRMQYNLEVLPSLDVSFQISPCPSRLREFIVRMDVVNKTSSQSLQVHQLSCVGRNWEVSLLQPFDTIFPSQYLAEGQTSSCLFKLKNGRKSEMAEGGGSSLAQDLGNDISLCNSSSSGLLFDMSTSPLAEFHNYEGSHQEVSLQGHPITVDFILISRPYGSSTEAESSNSPLLLSHHACHCSVASTRPIWWQVDGPHIIHHNFSLSFCEINLRMMIYNPSTAVAVVRLDTSDSGKSIFPRSASPGNLCGWHDVSLVDDTKVTSDVEGRGSVNLESTKSVCPIIWSGLSSNKVKLEPMTVAEIPLQASVFSPGTFDLSDYILHWKFVQPDDQDVRAGRGESSGTCPGQPYYLTVLQSSEQC